MQLWNTSRKTVNSFGIRYLWDLYVRGACGFDPNGEVHTEGGGDDCQGGSEKPGRLDERASLPGLAKHRSPARTRLAEPQSDERQRGFREHERRYEQGRLDDEEASEPPATGGVAVIAYGWRRLPGQLLCTREVPLRRRPPPSPPAPERASRRRQARARLSRTPARWCKTSGIEARSASTTYTAGNAITKSDDAHERVVDPRGRRAPAMLPRARR